MREVGVHFVNRVLSTKVLVCIGVMSYHHEGISYPQSFPARRASGDLDGLTVDCNHHGWSFTHCTPRHITQQCKIKHLASSLIQTLYLCRSSPSLSQPYLLMYGLMPSPVMGAMDMGMGSGVDSQ